MPLVALGFFASGIQDDAWRYLAVLAFLLLGGLILELARRTGRTLALLGGSLLGGLYVGLLPAFLFRIRALMGDDGLGMHATYLVFLVVWGCDTFAYTVGRLFGRHRFWPSVSPGKSWEGAVGGAAGAVILAVLAQRWFAGFLGLGEAVLFGLLAGVISQVGDLAESLLKREAALKDTSSLIPGHGGVMDRFDSLLFSAPFLYAYLLLRVQNGGS
jgi:phosphatidate cytidylyltransferase